jgi:WD40 repeat protein
MFSLYLNWHFSVKELFAVNDVQFHPKVHGTFATGGSDGKINVWDKDAKKRLKEFNACPAPITSLAFDEHGEWLVYASGYDYSKVNFPLTTLPSRSLSSPYTFTPTEFQQC